MHKIIKKMTLNTYSGIYMEALEITQPNFLIFYTLVTLIIKGN